MNPDPQPTVLLVDAETHGRAVVLLVTGEIDVMTASQLEESALRALEDTPVVLVVDLSGVTFLASAGLAVLVGIRKAAAHTPTDVRFVAAAPATLRPLQLMGLDQDLALYPTRDEALTDAPPS